MYTCPETTSASTTTVSEIEQTTTLTTDSTVATTTTTLSNEPKLPSVLVLNTRVKGYLPIILNRNGQVENDDFNENFLNSTLFYDNTGVSVSCGVTWRNQHFVFGGQGAGSDPQQIAQVVDPGCSLKRIGKLTHTLFVAGACTVMDDKIYFCFNYPDKQANKAKLMAFW